jgi:pimeloyl-ACP methyl ester carboxylesterase
MKKRTLTLYADVYGSGPTVVLLHGFLSSSGYWYKVIQLLKQNYKVIAIDLLGFGKSPKPKRSKYDYQAHLDAIKATLEKYRVKEPFMLIGHSMGALIALRYSVVYEKQVQRLVLVNMPIMFGKRELRREIFSLSYLNRFGLEFGLNRITWSTLKLLYRLRWLPQETMKRLRKNQSFFSHTPASRIRSFYNVIGSVQVADDLQKLKVQAVMLSGSEDMAVYFKNLKERITLSPTVQHSIYPTGHHIPWLMPECIAELVRSPMLVTR